MWAPVPQISASPLAIADSFITVTVGLPVSTNLIQIKRKQITTLLLTWSEHATMLLFSFVVAVAGHLISVQHRLGTELHSQSVLYRFVQRSQRASLYEYVGSWSSNWAAWYLVYCLEMSIKSVSSFSILIGERTCCIQLNPALSLSSFLISLCLSFSSLVISCFASVCRSLATVNSSLLMLHSPVAVVASSWQHKWIFSLKNCFVVTFKYFGVTSLTRTSLYVMLLTC